MRSCSTRWMMAYSCLVLAAATVGAQPISTAFTYQGELRTAGALASGLHDLRFRLYEAASGGTPVGPTLCVDNVSVSDGRFSAILDFLLAPSGQRRWLEIDVRADAGQGCADAMGFTVLSPRQEITAAPAAAFALSAGAAENALQLNGQSPAFYQNAANLSAGTLPSARLSGTYSSALSFSNPFNSFAGVGTGLTALNAANFASGTLADARLSSNVPRLNGANAFGAAMSLGAGLDFMSPSSGITFPNTTGASAPMIHMFTSGNSNADRMVLAHSPLFPDWGLQYRDATDVFHFVAGGVSKVAVNLPAGRLGIGTPTPAYPLHVEAGTSDRAVFGAYTATTGTGYGGRFETASNDGRAVFGLASSATGTATAVYGQSDSTTGRGISGIATAPTGLTWGANGQANSTSGVGVFGNATASTGNAYGVQGQSASVDGRGVYGRATALSGSTTGVYGQAVSSAGSGVFGDATSASGLTAGVHGRAASATGTGVFGEAVNSSGISYGGRFQNSSPDGAGVYGSNTSTTGTTSGVYGRSLSSAGRGVAGYVNAEAGFSYGVHGVSDSLSGTGVYGEATSTESGLSYGVRGVAASPIGAAVYGLHTATTGSAYGGQFRTSSEDGYGVVASADSLTGYTIGMRGHVSSPLGVGVSGWAISSSGPTSGVAGLAFSTSGRGVFGSATADSGVAMGGYFRSSSTEGRGVYAEASSTTGVNFGVHGQSNSSSPSAFGVYATGRLGASGTKSFRIDHPADPENKYLLHYSTESPEVLNAYRGTVTLDGAGEAVVELPAYFASINKDPSYQLTAVGAPMPLLHIAEEIDDGALRAGEQAARGEAVPICSFRIAGGAPGAKVSWEVKAVRNDLWMRNRAAPVEVDKEGVEHGTYQHPEFYGLPKERAAHYDAAHEGSLARAARAAARDPDDHR